MKTLKPLLCFNPLGGVVHQTDASTSLRETAKKVAMIGRAWCGESLTERGGVTHNIYNRQHSTMVVFHRSVPQKSKCRIRSLTFTIPLFLTITLRGSAYE